MNDIHDPGHTSDPYGPDEVLSAYLAGELDDAAVAAFEQRLADEPALARQLEALTDALVRLGGIDHIDTPDGFAQRLDARLRGEAAAADLDAARQRHANRRLAPLLSAAAGVLLVVFAGVQLLRPGTPPVGGDLAMESAQEFDASTQALEESSLSASSSNTELRESSETAESLAVPAPPVQDGSQGKLAERSDDSAAGSGGGGGSAADSTADSPSMTTSDSGVVIADDERMFMHDDELLVHFQGRPEAERLRGMAHSQATETAALHVEQVHEAPPFRSGTAPDQCLKTVKAGDNGRIVARVERIGWQGEEAIAYLLAISDGQGVDRFELWVTAVDACALRRQLDWR